MEREVLHVANMTNGLLVRPDYDYIVYFPSSYTAAGTPLYFPEFAVPIDLIKALLEEKKAIFYDATVHENKELTDAFLKGVPTFLMALNRAIHGTKGLLEKIQEGYKVCPWQTPDIVHHAVYRLPKHYYKFLKKCVKLFAPEKRGKLWVSIPENVELVVEKIDRHLNDNYELIATLIKEGKSLREL
ncbi:MAG: hypothetical protein GXO04_03655 [Aquificae bacterium]|nr:hypothetical protein [Aquificota bacterium]